MAEMAFKKRPKFLELWKIRLPLPGVVSILHRISGFGMFLLLPAVLYVFGLSLSSPQGYEDARAIVTHPFAKLIWFGLMWAYLHHFCAGIRFLLLDMHTGIELRAARSGAVIVLAVSLTLTIILAAVLL